MSPEKSSEAANPVSPKAVLAAMVSWLIPGAGHFLLKRPARGAVFLGLIVLSVAIGCSLDGRLTWPWSGSPLLALKHLGAMGSGGIYLVLRFFLGYEGDIRAPGHDYGTAFIVTAGLMNFLVVLDVWDIALGREKGPAPVGDPE